MIRVTLALVALSITAACGPSVPQFNPAPSQSDKKQCGSNEDCASGSCDTTTGRCR
jgi:hypothetical protein